MSIFSRLLKRGPEDGSGAAAEQPSPKDKPAVEKEKDKEKGERAAQAAPPPPAPAQAAAPPPKPEAKPAPKPEPKAEAKPEPKAETKPEPKPEPKVEAKPDAKNGQANGKVATKPYMAVPKGLAPSPSVPSPGMVPPHTTPPRPGTSVASAPAALPRRTPGSPRPAASDDNGAVPTEPMRVPPSSKFEQDIERALAGATAAAAAKPDPAGNTTASDRAAMMSTFEDLAVPHTAQVRSLMLEVRWGEAQASWIELSRPALRSLRSMSGQIENSPLTSALDGFDAALDKALAPGAPPVVSGATRDALLAAYAPLTACLPRAFDLEGERDRREPLVVRALLGQVQGLDPLMIDRMTAAGLGRIETLVRARADEIAAVAGVTADVAEAAAARVQAFRRETQASLATLDPAATTRELGALYRTLAGEHRAFEDAAAGWSDKSPALKRQLRRQRDVTFLQITIALARLGEIDLALRLEKLAFAKRIEEVERFLTRVMPSALAPAEREAADEDKGKKADTTRIETGHQRGAHAAP